MLAVAQRAHTGALTIGTSNRNDVVLAHRAIPSARFAVVTLAHGTTTVHAAPGMVLCLDDVVVDALDVVLPHDSRAIVRMGNLTLEVQHRAPQRAPQVQGLTLHDVLHARISGAALAAELALVLACLWLPPPAHNDVDDLAQLRRDYTRVLTPRRPPPRPRTPTPHSTRAAVTSSRAPAAHAQATRPAARGAPRIDRSQRESDRQSALVQLAAMGLGAHATSAVFSPDVVTDALGALHGVAIGDGGGGLGTRTLGTSGDEPGLHIGGVSARIDRGPVGGDDVDLAARGHPSAHVPLGRVVFEGALSREEIQRVLSRALSQIKYCYERELTRDPTLQGKVVAQWSIDATGHVTGAALAEDTFTTSGAPVGSCVLRVLQRMQFPMPKGGGAVSVTYPFVFTAAGA